ncbi:MAG: VOC family protein [Pseudomonadota bacterium]
MKMNQVTLGTTDFEASVAFYSMLGLIVIVHSPPRYARFECPQGDEGGAPATLSIHATEVVADTEWPLVYFETDRLDKDIDRLRRAGVPILSEPEDKDYLWREADIADPAGNRIRLYTAGENRRFPPWRVGSVAE